MASNDKDGLLLLAGRRFYFNVWYLVDLIQVDTKQQVVIGHCKSKQLVDVTDFILSKAGATPTDEQLRAIVEDLILLQVGAIVRTSKGLEQ